MNNSDIRLRVVVVIPMYRSQAKIAEVLGAIPQFVDYVIVVDDCSPDDSYQFAAAAADHRTVFIRHEVNQGVGGAVLSGYARAVELQADIIVKVDADNQMDLSYLPQLISPIKNGHADYTKGNRFLHSRQLRTMPAIRLVGNLGLSFMTKLASGYWNIFDPTNGYTAIRVSILPMLNKGSIDKRYFFETSMLLELGLVRAVVRDVHIPAKYENELSSLSEIHALFGFPPRLMIGLIRRIWIHYFLLDFSLVSLYLISGFFLLMFGLAFGSYHWWTAAQMQVATQTGTVMLAVLPVILGAQILLQALSLDVQNVPGQTISQ